MAMLGCLIRPTQVSEGQGNDRRVATSPPANPSLSVSKPANGSEDAKTLAIWRPVKREDTSGIEVGDLVPGSALDGLNPVIHAILRDRIGDELPFCPKLHAIGDSWVGVKNARRAESLTVGKPNTRFRAAAAEGRGISRRGFGSVPGGRRAD
jgi:hypothetical protein